MQDVLPPSIHPDTGRPYEWIGDFTEIPPLPDALRQLWHELAAAPTARDGRQSRQSKLRAGDPVYQALKARGAIRRDRQDGASDIVCPFEREHTTKGSESETIYYPAHTGGYSTARIHCMHAHCEQRPMAEYLLELEIGDVAPAAAADLTPKALTDFYHYAPDNRCLYLPTGDLWAGASVDQAIATWPEESGKAVKPSRWLGRYRAIDQLTWHPGQPQVQEGVSVRDGGYVKDGKTRVFNLYRPPVMRDGDPRQATLWLEHIARIYPETHGHITLWLAHRVQRPGDKVNHALVLGGEQGIGKDSLLEPIKAAVGAWNVSEISPAQMLGRFNGWAKAVVVRVSEARDLGDTDRFAFYDHSKTYIAAPPDVIRVDEKNLREYQVFNVCGVVITTNHKTDGIYLPPDDRRHHVSWSDAMRADFDESYWRALWGFFESGGVHHVAAYLRSLDLSAFNPKAPPPRTRAFEAIVAASNNPEDAEIADLLDAIGNPTAVTIDQLAGEANRQQRTEIHFTLTNHKHRRAVPHKLERAGYEPVRNPDAVDGLFKIDGRRRTVYAKRGLGLAEQLRAARAIRCV